MLPIYITQLLFFFLVLFLLSIVSTVKVINSYSIPAMCNFDECLPGHLIFYKCFFLISPFSPTTQGLQFHVYFCLLTSTNFQEDVKKYHIWMFYLNIFFILHFAKKETWPLSRLPFKFICPLQHFIKLLH